MVLDVTSSTHQLTNPDTLARWFTRALMSTQINVSVTVVDGALQIVGRQSDVERLIHFLDDAALCPPPIEQVLGQAPLLDERPVPANQFVRRAA